MVAFHFCPVSSCCQLLDATVSLPREVYLFLAQLCYDYFYPMRMDFKKGKVTLGELKLIDWRLLGKLFDGHYYLVIFYLYYFSLNLDLHRMTKKKKYFCFHISLHLFVWWFLLY